MVKKGDVMTKHPSETSKQADESDPDELVVEVLNPRYKGATPLMVARALLQRPKKDDQKVDGDDR